MVIKRQNPKRLSLVENMFKISLGTTWNFEGREGQSMKKTCFFSYIPTIWLKQYKVLFKIKPADLWRKKKATSSTSTHVMIVTKDAQSPECYICKCNFCANRRLFQHLNTSCRKNNITWKVDVNINNHSAVLQENLSQQDQEHENFYWITVPGSVYQKDLEEAYEQIVYCCKNVFMVPTGTSIY